MAVLTARQRDLAQAQVLFMAEVQGCTYVTSLTAAAIWLMPGAVHPYLVQALQTKAAAAILQYNSIGKSCVLPGSCCPDDYLCIVLVVIQGKANLHSWVWNILVVQTSLEVGQRGCAACGVRHDLQCTRKLSNNKEFKLFGKKECQGV